MNMRYCDFKKVEATYYYINKVKNGNSSTEKASNDESTKQDLAQLGTVYAKDLDLPKEYLSIF